MEPSVDPAVRLVLNAALMQLTEYWNEEAARLVIQHCHNFPAQGLISSESTETTWREDTPVLGYTGKQGNVPISTPAMKTVEHSSGVHKARIGQFRVYRARGGAIEFHHFWKSNLTTMSPNEDEHPKVYRLGYDQKTLEPLFLAVWGKKPVFRIPLTCTTIVCYFLVPMHGEVVGIEKVFGLETIINQ